MNACEVKSAISVPTPDSGDSHHPGAGLIAHLAALDQGQVVTQPVNPIVGAAFAKIELVDSSYVTGEVLTLLGGETTAA